MAMSNESREKLFNAYLSAIDKLNSGEMTAEQFEAVKNKVSLMLVPE